MFSPRPSIQALKIQEALAIIIHNGGTDATVKNKIAHLFWVADRLAIRNYGTLFFEHDYRSCELGPIPFTVCGLIQQWSHFPDCDLKIIRDSFDITEHHIYVDDPDISNEHLSEVERNILLAACDMFYEYSAKELAEYAKQFPEANTHMSHEDVFNPINPIVFFESIEDDFCECNPDILQALKAYYINSQHEIDELRRNRR